MVEMKEIPKIYQQHIVPTFFNSPGNVHVQMEFGHFLDQDFFFKKVPYYLLFHPI